MFKHYLKGKTAPASYNESNDCSVRAVANASGKSYEDVHSIMKALGRKDGHFMDMRMCAAGAMRAGGKIKIVNINLSQLSNGKFVIFQEGHCFAYVSGKIIDATPVDTKKSIIGVFEFK